MNPRLKKHFSNFKDRFEITIPDSLSEHEKNLKESHSFEQFVNFTIFSLDYPEVFTGEIHLLNAISVGGTHDTGIDGLAIKVNDIIVKSVDEVKDILKENKHVEYDYVFIQSKMQEKFDASEFTTFAQGVENFLSKESALPENDKLKNLRKIKNFLDSDKSVNDKLKRNSFITLYYVSAGAPPTDNHFLGVKDLIAKKLGSPPYYFEEVRIELIDGKKIIGYCDELENNFQVRLNILDSYPLMVGESEDILKAYAFTCTAKEYLEILRKKDDDSLRRHLFNDNVRDYLGTKKESSVNSEIEKSIIDNPEMFLLCNNGITIVCSDYNNIKDKLIQIDNPQIVNGCQTSNSIFNQRHNPNIDNVKVSVKLICTENPRISNIIVRGTNKQNQVLDEDFEVTRSFHQDVLEPFFLAIDYDPQLYYERRHKQYFGTKIPTTRIVNLRILCQTYTAVFLEAPHDAYKHQKIILDLYGGEKFKRKIFRDEHSEYPYYVSAVMWYMFEKYINRHKYRNHEHFRWHLYLILKYLSGQTIVDKRLNKNNKKIVVACERILDLLAPSKFENNLKKSIEIFNGVRIKWVKSGKSEHGIKDNRDFTRFLLKNLDKKFVTQKIEIDSSKPDEDKYVGKILHVRFISSDFWYSHIASDDFEFNIYFDSRTYKGEVRKIIPKANVEFSIYKIEKGKASAKNIRIL